MIPPIAKIAAVAATGLALTAVAVYPQLSARLTGEEIQLRVAPVDPIDPFRGAYVDLRYPDLNRLGSEERGIDDGESGDVFLTLRKKGDVWVGDVGDNLEHDVAPPKSLGMRTVWARRAAKGRERPPVVDADHVVDDFGELHEILKGEYGIPL